jgi:hypothetical protein
MTLSQLDEPLRSKIVLMTADVFYWFVTYHSSVTSTATYFSSHEAATSFRGIVEHSVNGSDTMKWSYGRLPKYMHGNLGYVLITCSWVTMCQHCSLLLQYSQCSCNVCHTCANHRWLAGHRSLIDSSSVMTEQPRCIMPNIGHQSADSKAKWPHQIVNATCPRFAMMRISVEQGLAHRYSEVSTYYCL